MLHHVHAIPLHVHFVLVFFLSSEVVYAELYSKLGFDFDASKCSFNTLLITMVVTIAVAVALFIAG